MTLVKAIDLQYLNTKGAHINKRLARNKRAGPVTVSLVVVIVDIVVMVMSHYTDIAGCVNNVYTSRILCGIIRSNHNVNNYRNYRNYRKLAVLINIFDRMI